jgi:hypothetical protein
MPPPTHPRLAKDLLGYYVRHPQAADTAEGLVRWRLLEEWVERTLRETEDALNWLVAQGYLQQRTVAGRPPLFVLNSERQSEAEAFLEREGGGGER